MKKILLLLVMCVMATAAWAEDVIVGLDGSMTLSKVVEITQTEIKYKKAGNLEGPTLSVLKSQVKSILYENGTTEEIAQVRMKDLNVKYGRNFKLASWMVGGSMFLADMAIDYEIIAPPTEEELAAWREEMQNDPELADKKYSRGVYMGTL